MSFKKVRDAHKTENTEDYLEIIADLLKQQEINFFEIDAISFSSQMLGCIILDEYDKPIRPAILWNDARSSEESYYLEKNHSKILKSSIYLKWDKTY